MSNGLNRTTASIYTRRRVLAGVAAVTAAPAALAAGSAPFGGSGGQRSGQVAHTGIVHDVEIQGLVFVPDRLTVAPGDHIVWTNRDLSPHTATAEDDSWDTGSLDKDESGEIVVSSDMVGKYYCRFHPHMRAELVIKVEG